MLFQVRAKTRNIGDIERQECEAARRQERRAIQTSGEEIIKCERSHERYQLSDLDRVQRVALAPGSADGSSP